MKRFDWINFLVICLIVFGIGLALYPFLSQYYYRYEAKNQVNLFETSKNNYSQEDLERLRSLEEGYNKSLHGYGDWEKKDLLDKKNGRDYYLEILKKKELIASVVIPNIGQELPVYMGSSEEVLQKGAGLLENSSLPLGGSSTHSVITAHRGLPEARLFTDLDKLELEDIFYVKNKYETLAYEVVAIEVISPDDFSAISIVENKDYITLLTCTPYMINSHRLIVRGERMDYADMDLEDPYLKSLRLLKIFFFIMAGLDLICLVFLVHSFRGREEIINEKKN